MSKTKKSFFSRISNWFRGMKSELKKVVWPTSKQIINNSLVVLVVMIIAGLAIGGLDLLTSYIVNWLNSISTISISIFG